MVDKNRATAAAVQGFDAGFGVAVLPSLLLRHAVLKQERARVLRNRLLALAGTAGAAGIVGLISRRRKKKD